ncbi:MAG: TlpA disulfide reductase family protein [Deltaproteobacteria bacterium]|nr:TlpA disulfide reductase family protein [Deltaproteobacteria bacterium]
MRRLTVLALGLLVLSGAQGFAAGGGIVGKRAPDFTGKQVSGEPLSLSRYLGKAPVILTFWSIYCKSCTEEMSALQRLYAKYGPEKVTVIAVNEDGDVGLARVRKFLDHFASAGGDGTKLTFPMFFDEKGEVFAKYSVVHLPTLVYIDRDGTVRDFIEGFERGRELSVFSAIEKLIDSVSPGPLKEVASEAVYELDLSAPVCGVYRDGKWYRPLDLDESGRPEAIARARSEGEESLRREAMNLALSQLGFSIRAQDRPPGCFAGYGMEIRTPRWKKDPLDLLIERLNLPRIMEVVSQETVERERELVLYRRIKIRLDALKEQLDADGYAAAKSSIRIRFVRASRLEERAFVEAIRTQFPYLSSLEKETTPRGETGYLLVSHAPADKVVEKLRGLDVGPPKLSVDLLPGNIAEVAMWR